MRSKYQRISIAVGSILLLQLLFFWLVPRDIASYEILYFFATLYTMGLSVCTLIISEKYGIRKTMLGIMINWGFDCVVVGVTILVSSVNVDARNTIFIFAGIAALYIVLGVPLMMSYHNNKKDIINGVIVDNNYVDDASVLWRNDMKKKKANDEWG